MKPVPKVSVVMSVHNGARYLGESVESILRQTFSDFEFVIVDDGSQDETWELLQEWAQRDHRIRLLRNDQNIGLTRSLNQGLAVARGEYIARQDADDISFPTRFERQVACLDAHAQVELVSSNVEFVDHEGRPLGRSRRNAEPDLIAWHLVFHNYVAGHSAAMFRRKTVSELGGYDEAYPYSQDHALWLQLSRLGEVMVLPEVLLQFRYHDRSISHQAAMEQDRCSLEVAQKELSRLAGGAVSLSEARILRAFWTGRLTRVKDLPLVNRRLRQVHREFLCERKRRKKFSADVCITLRKAIARQFYDCSKKVNIGKRLMLESAAWTYALQWHVPTALALCVAEIAMLPYYLARAAVRRAVNTAGARSTGLLP